MSSWLPQLNRPQSSRLRYSTAKSGGKEDVGSDAVQMEGLLIAKRSSHAASSNTHILLTKSQYLLEYRAWFCT